MDGVNFTLSWTDCADVKVSWARYEPEKATAAESWIDDDGLKNIPCLRDFKCDNEKVVILFEFFKESAILRDGVFKTYQRCVQEIENYLVKDYDDIDPGLGIESDDVLLNVTHVIEQWLVMVPSMYLPHCLFQLTLSKGAYECSVSMLITKSGSFEEWILQLFIAFEIIKHLGDLEMRLSREPIISIIQTCNREFGRESTSFDLKDYLIPYFYKRLIDASPSPPSTADQPQSANSKGYTESNQDPEETGSDFSINGNKKEKIKKVLELVPVVGGFINIHDGIKDFKNKKYLSATANLVGGAADLALTFTPFGLAAKSSYQLGLRASGLIWKSVLKKAAIQTAGAVASSGALRGINASAKREVLANLANFAYNPVNYVFMRKLNIIDVFLDCLSNSDEAIIEFAAAGLCNLAADPINKGIIFEKGGVTKLAALLKHENIEIIIPTLTSLIFLVSPASLSSLTLPETIQQVIRLKDQGNERIKNLVNIYLEDICSKESIEAVVGKT